MEDVIMPAGSPVGANNIGADEQGLSVAIAGATGAVGREMLAVLEERSFPVKSLKLLASKRSAGEELDFSGKSYVVEELTADSFRGIDIALFSAGASVSREFCPAAAQAGAIVIDNSSAFRMDPQIPLVVPEVNAAYLRTELQKLKPGAGLIVANPNCSTIQLVVILQPIQQAAGLKRVVVSTYQSVSGAGKKGMDELWEQTKAIFMQQDPKTEKFPHRIAFNCLPHIDVFLDNGYTKEEWKIIEESRKIMALPNLKITSTAVRVPVFTCHSESVNIETERPLSADDTRTLLRESPGVVVIDDPKSNSYPINGDLTGTDATFVGRIRNDDSVENGINLWVVADNLRKGAALNAVQIAEIALQTKRDAGA
jgi:aspartate-semialdehyde dehydrogenase